LLLSQAWRTIAHWHGTIPQDPIDPFGRGLSCNAPSPRRSGRASNSVCTGRNWYRKGLDFLTPGRESSRLNPAKFHEPPAQGREANAERAPNWGTCKNLTTGNLSDPRANRRARVRQVHRPTRGLRPAKDRCFGRTVPDLRVCGFESRVAPIIGSGRPRSTHGVKNPPRRKIRTHYFGDHHVCPDGRDD